MWWGTPAIPVLGSWGQEGQEFKASLGYGKPWFRIKRNFSENPHRQPRGRPSHNQQRAGLARGLAVSQLLRRQLRL